MEVVEIMASTMVATAVASAPRKAPAGRRRVAFIEPAVTEFGDRIDHSRLTSLELEATLQAAAGRSNRQIADHMFLSVRTVECHLQHVYEKLGVNARHDLADALGLRITVEFVDSACAE
jgi:DNA-binding CsgD family transcriptional regulator